MWEPEGPLGTLRRQGAEGRGKVAGACLGEPSEAFEQGSGLIRMML